MLRNLGATTFVFQSTCKRLWCFQCLSTLIPTMLNCGRSVARLLTILWRNSSQTSALSSMWTILSDSKIDTSSSSFPPIPLFLSVTIRWSITVSGILSTPIRNSGQWQKELTTMTGQGTNRFSSWSLLAICGSRYLNTEPHRVWLEHLERKRERDRENKNNITPSTSYCWLFLKSQTTTFWMVQKPCKSWDFNYQPQLVSTPDFWTINSMSSNPKVPVPSIVSLVVVDPTATWPRRYGESTRRLGVRRKDWRKCGVQLHNLIVPTKKGI